MLNEALPFIHRFIEKILRRRICLKQVILYGSFADESASPESDIDLKIFTKYESDKGKILKIEDEIKKENLLKKHILTYSTDDLEQVKRAELSRRLLGYKIGNKYSFRGILSDTNSKRLRNAIICDDASTILKILKSYENIKVENSIIYMPQHSKFVEKEDKVN